MKNISQNHILFKLMIQLYHHIVLKIQEKSFKINNNKIMTFDGQIEDEKVQYVICRDTAERSALSSGKIDKYEYLTGKEISPSN